MSDNKTDILSEAADRLLNAHDIYGSLVIKTLEFMYVKGRMDENIECAKIVESYRDRRDAGWQNMAAAAKEIREREKIVKKDED